MPVVGLDDLRAKRVGQAIRQHTRGPTGRRLGAVQAVGGLDRGPDEDEGPAGPERTGLIEDEPHRKQRDTRGPGRAAFGGEQHARGSGADLLEGRLGLRASFREDEDRATRAQRRRGRFEERDVLAGRRPPPCGDGPGGP